MPRELRLLNIGTTKADPAPNTVPPAPTLQDLVAMPTPDERDRRLTAALTPQEVK